MISTIVFKQARKLIPADFIYSKWVSIVSVVSTIAFNYAIFVYGAVDIEQNSVLGYKFSDENYWVFYVFLFAAFFDVVLSIADLLKFKTYPFRVYLLRDYEAMDFIPFKTRGEAEEYKFNLYLSRTHDSFKERVIEAEVFSQYERLSGKLQKIWS